MLSLNFLEEQEYICKMMVMVICSDVMYNTVGKRSNKTIHQHLPLREIWGDKEQPNMDEDHKDDLEKKFSQYILPQKQRPEEWKYDL